jgi:hypothetical protein
VILLGLALGAVAWFSLGAVIRFEKQRRARGLPDLAVE